VLAKNAARTLCCRTALSGLTPNQTRGTIGIYNFRKTSGRKWLETRMKWAERNLNPKGQTLTDLINNSTCYTITETCFSLDLELPLSRL